MDPSPSGTFASVSTNVDVSTNNRTGYTLSLSTVTTNNNLNFNGDTAATNVIAPLTTSTTLADFSSTTHTASMDKWGFTTDNNGTGEGQILTDTYLPVQGSDNSRTIKVTTEAANVSNTNITFATKVDRSLPAGVYSNTVLFTATANVDPTAYMQDFTTADCNELVAWGYDSVTDTVIRGSTRYLWDRRDGQSYAVRKLADGNCWMVENFNLSAESLAANNHSTTLDSADTDLTPGITFTVPATNNTYWGGDSYPVEPKIAASSQESYVDYGMYYNWWAATASTDDLTSGVAENSICPKGWTLPTGWTDGQFHEMFLAHQAAYGFIVIDGTGNDMSKVNRTDVLSGDTVGPNLQFSGYWHHSGVAPGGRSTDGRWWASVVISRNIASDASISIKSGGKVASSTSDSYKRHGFPVRCLLDPSS